MVVLYNSLCFGIYDRPIILAILAYQSVRHLREKRFVVMRVSAVILLVTSYVNKRTTQQQNYVH